MVLIGEALIALLWLPFTRGLSGGRVRDNEIFGDSEKRNDGLGEYDSGRRDSRHALTGRDIYSPAPAATRHTVSTWPSSHVIAGETETHSMRDTPWI